MISCEDAIKLVEKYREIAEIHSRIANQLLLFSTGGITIEELEKRYAAAHRRLDVCADEITQVLEVANNA
jgi:hypothetical protein